MSSPGLIHLLVCKFIPSASPEFPHLLVATILSVFMSLAFSDSTYTWDHIFVFLWLISLSTVPSQSIHGVANGRQEFLLSLGWIIFHCEHTPHLYPFTCWPTCRLFPRLGCCKSFCTKRECTNLFEVLFSFPWDADPGVELLDHGVLQFFKESLYCFP